MPVRPIGGGGGAGAAPPPFGGGNVLRPSGDTSFATDTAAINASLNANRTTILAPGEWYVGGAGITQNDRTLRGSGYGTVINGPVGGTTLTLSGPGQCTVSDMTFKGGDYAIKVNGAYDTDFKNLHITGQKLGGVRIDGDLATEQHWTDVIFRGVGGVAFGLYRTTTIYTGSQYLDRVRIVEPAAGATHGFLFTSTAAQPSLNIAFLTQCVADNYAGTACEVVNCAQVFMAQCWFAINGAGPAGSAALKVTGGFMQSYTGCYTYSGMTAAASPSVVVTGGARGVDIGGGHVFDGTPTTTMLGLNGAAPGGVTVDTYQNYCGGTLVDRPDLLNVPARALPGVTNTRGEEVMSRLFCTATPPLSSGTLVLSYFTAAKTELISTIECMVNTAASGGTYAGMGLYTVAANGNLTLVAKGEATTLWTSAFQPVNGFNTKIGLTAPYQKVAGQRYAVGALFVGTTAPALVSAVPSSGTPGSNGTVTGTTLGALSGQKASQTTLGTVGTTTHTAASLSGWSWMPWFVLN